MGCMTRRRPSIGHRAEDAAARAILGAAMGLPYPRRIAVVGAAVSRIVAPLAGWRERIRANLAHVLPELSQAEVTRLVQAVPDNAGRTLAEMYSGSEFLERVSGTPISGPGADIFLSRLSEGRPTIVATAHFGNYLAISAALRYRGHVVPALYRPMRNPAFNEHYVARMAEIAGEVHPTDRRGVLAVTRRLARGGAVGILSDVYEDGGAPVTFFGRTAPAATSIAQWALRFDAALIPAFAIRQPDGLGFEVRVHSPVVPDSDPVVMVQAYNDALEAEVRAHLAQWFWIHRRWKPGLGTAAG